MAAYELFFGRTLPGNGEVSDAAWSRFLLTVVTPDLPDGYTVFDGAGYWRDPATGNSVRERTKVLLAAVPDTPGSAAAINRIRQAYATTFHQSVVGMTETPVCGSF